MFYILCYHLYVLQISPLRRHLYTVPTGPLSSELSSCQSFLFVLSFSIFFLKKNPSIFANNTV